MIWEDALYANNLVANEHVVGVGICDHDTSIIIKLNGLGVVLRIRIENGRVRVRRVEA